MFQAAAFGTIVRAPAGETLGRVNVYEVDPPMDGPSLDWVEFVMFSRGAMHAGSPEPEPGMTVEVRFEAGAERPLRAALVTPAGWCVGCSSIRPLVSPFEYNPRYQQGALGHCRACLRTRGPASPPAIDTPPNRHAWEDDAAFGRMGETLVARICREQGLSVLPFGIEHTSEELRKLARVGQMGSDAGWAVRSMPDLAVYWPGEGGRTFWLLEVKTRRGDPIAPRFPDPRGAGYDAIDDRWCTTPGQLAMLRQHWPSATLAVVSFSIDPQDGRLACLVRAAPVSSLPEPRECGYDAGRSPRVCIDVHRFQPLARLLSLDRSVCEQTIRAFLAEHHHEIRERIAKRTIHRCGDRH
ncbi:MAG TPA: hypothetical protein VFJ16_06865 [Longimicrobium sp.]|nr:hypothetical protein [Longimicrobium sp.]